MNIYSKAMCAVGALAVAAGAQAAMIQVDMSPYVNYDWTLASSGADYPAGLVTIGAVDFQVAPYSGGTGTGGIALAGNTSVTIAIGQTDIKTAFVVMNSAWGTLGANNGSLTFAGGGNSVTFDLIQGVNIRDHATSYNQVASDILATVSYPGGNRWDSYAYDISALGGTLDSVTFTSLNGGRPQGEPIMTALTLATAVPEPATWAMLIVGFGAVGLASRRRSRHLPA